MALRFTWTDGNDKAFRDFYLITEAYYSRIAGGEENRILNDVLSGIPEKIRSLPNFREQLFLWRKFLRTRRRR